VNKIIELFITANCKRRYFWPVVNNFEKERDAYFIEHFTRYDCLMKTEYCEGNYPVNKKRFLNYFSNITTLQQCYNIIEMFQNISCLLNNKNYWFRYILIFLHISPFVKRQSFIRKQIVNLLRSIISLYKTTI